MTRATNLARAGAALALAALCLAAAPAVSDTAATTRYLASIRNRPAVLYTFLREMPKGGDLHNHLSGAIYAESFIAWGAADGGCLATDTMTLTAGPCDASGRIPLTTVIATAANGTYGRAIDAMSMRNWDATLNGHDHFFATFARFGAAMKPGEALAEVARRAADEHVSYLELMVTPTGAKTASLAADQTLTCPADPHASCDPAFAALQDRLAKAGYLTTAQDEARDLVRTSEAREASLLGCAAAPHAPGCDVTIRYIAQVARAGTLPRVFGQILSGFETASHIPQIVSLNLVQPEDDPNAIRDFDRQMEMLAFLRRQPAYARVPITLHAGELTDGLVPPESLRSHIRASIDTGGARRIGHGVDVLHEDGSLALLKLMAARKVMVEIALTSNDVILGVRGPQHPLHAYLRAGVPVALVTDDPGVARSSMTLEYRKAVLDQNLDYQTLKKLARNSIDFAFVEDAKKSELRARLDADFAVFEHVPRDR